MPELAELADQGIAGLMRNLDADLPPGDATPPTPPTPPEPPAAPPKPPETPPATKPPETPPKTPEAKKDVDDAEVEKERKSNPNHKAWKILDSVKAKHAAETAPLKAKIAELESRPQSSANDAKLAELQKLLDERSNEIKTWKQRTEEADYTRSEEYTTKYVQPYQTEKARALDEIKRLNFRYTETDAEGNQAAKTRPATEADFAKAMSLPPSEQDEFLDAAFGKSAFRISNRINELERIRSASVQATEDFSKNYEKNKTERELAAQRESEEYIRDFESEHKRLQSDPELGKYVSESDQDPDGTKLFKAELEKFDGYKTAMQAMAPKDRAAVAALVRARFAGTPRLLSANKQQAAKIAALEAELAGIRKVDPGTARGASGSPAPAATPGIREMAVQFDSKV